MSGIVELSGPGFVRVRLTSGVITANPRGRLFAVGTLVVVAKVGAEWVVVA